ncbi:protein argonaute 2-like [Pistacia vera]|uniref:protein argonaute 2-like n=1 Tax=Pistacia vera TaxID=55513 RepID=UPI001263BE61|nr:protein argonaute 2-like [Pistacia vera]
MFEKDGLLTLYRLGSVYCDGIETIFLLSILCVFASHLHVFTYDGTACRIMTYQSPIPVDQVKPLTEYYDGEAAPGMRGRVRHDQGQGKNGGTGNGVAEYSNGHWDGGRGYGGRGRGYARGRSSRGRGRWYGGGNMQHESGYNNGYSGSGAFPPQGRGRGRGRGSGHGHGLGFRSDGPVQVQATA